MQDKPLAVDEGAAKEQYFKAAFASAVDEEALTCEVPTVKLSKRLKPVLCSLDDMFRAVVDTVEGANARLQEHTSLCSMHTSLASKTQCLLLLRCLSLHHMCGLPILQCMHLGFKAVKDQAMHVSAAETPKVPQNEELQAQNMRGHFISFKRQGTGTALLRNNSQVTHPCAHAAEPKHLSAYDGSQGYLQAMRSVRSGRHRTTPHNRSKSIADSLPPDLQHTAAQLHGTLEHIRSIPVSEHARRSTATLEASRAGVTSQTGRSATRGGSIIPGLRRELCDAGPAFAEFCRLQEERWERQQQRQAAAAAAAQPVLRSASLALQLASPPSSGQQAPGRSAGGAAVLRRDESARAMVNISVGVDTKLLSSAAADIEHLCGSIVHMLHLALLPHLAAILLL